MTNKRNERLLARQANRQVRIKTNKMPDMQTGRQVPIHSIGLKKRQAHWQSMTTIYQIKYPT